MFRTNYMVELNACDLLHDTIKLLIKDFGFSQAYYKIAISRYPLFVRSKKKYISNRLFEQLTLYAESLLKKEYMSIESASCLSISLTIHSLLFQNGIQSVLNIGIAKDDMRLISHSWLDLGKSKIIDPTNERHNLKVIKALKMEDQILKWIEN